MTGQATSGERWRPPYRTYQRHNLDMPDVGIAMGSGTDVAIESTGITLPKGDLMGVVKSRRLSEATTANIRQNLVFAFIYNAAGIPIAAGLHYPAFGLLLSPIIAAPPWRLNGQRH